MSDEPVLAPWWHAPWRLVILAVAFVLLGVTVGYVVWGRSDTSPGAASVDVGFLHDMRFHHDQAVGMSLIYLSKDQSTLDAGLKSIANEVILEQQLENGVMVHMLSLWHEAEASESDTAMAWMNLPVPREQMPGFASADDIAKLRAATGKEADKLYAALLIAHHQGGIHMADYAAARARRAQVRNLAGSMAKAQRSEIIELQSILARVSA